MASAAKHASAGDVAPDTGADQFQAVRAVADAVLYEGYLLYPYRRSSVKNRVRWQFGVLAPRQWIAVQQIPDPGVAGSSESWWQQVECLAEVRPAASLTVRLRFLQLQRRQVFTVDETGGRHPVDSLGDGATGLVSFDEAVPREVTARFPVADLLAGASELAVEFPPGRTVQTVRDPAGRPLGELARTSSALAARLLATAEPAEAPFPLLRFRVRVENLAGCANPAAPREQVLGSCLIATHLLLGLDSGTFLSALDPPAWAAAAAATCRNQHTFPVLAGPDVLLCSPIILYDHPQIAPESPGDLHDAAEIDEILSLRTMTLTEAEKREARATDPRSAAIVDRVDAMPAEMLAKLHGAVRELRPLRPPAGQAPDATPEQPEELPWWDPRAEAAVNPAADTVLVGGRPIGRGAWVRLRPRGRGSDAHDMFLTGRIAQVHAVLHDVDGSSRVAVTVADDPAADLQDWYRRYFHFSPEEIEPLGDAP
jgi:hypothetical protein